MPIYYDKGKKAYRFQYNRVFNGKRYRSSRLLPAGWSQAQADTFDRKESARLHALATGIEQERPLISQAIALYLTHWVPSLKNAKHTAQCLALLLPYTEGKTLDQLPEIAREYRKNTNLAPATVRQRLAWLRAAVRYAFREHELGDQDYTARMRLPAVHNARHVYLRVKEMEKLRNACSDPDGKALIRIAFYTGCRWASEILPRKPEDIIKGRQWWLVIGKTKNGAPKMIPIHNVIKPDLKRLPFTKHQRTYYEMFEQAREKAGMTHVVMQDLRHSLASALISQGATLKVVGEALGHKSGQSTERYAHLYPEAVARAIRKMPVAKRRKKAA